jgi:D-ribose pyranase
MKKTPLLHAALSHVIARMGHGDMLVIADAGLPVPAGPQHIDLAVTRGVPAFADVLQAVLSEMQVERAVLASELRTRSADFHSRIAHSLPGITIDEMDHLALKALTQRAVAIVRTGEFTPYANIVLIAGVVF